MSDASPRFVLASSSPARLATLRAAGLDPEVIVSGVDETRVDASCAADHALVLARRKADAVSERFDRADRRAGDTADPRARDTLILGCDSVLELDGEIHGKPGTPAVAVERWRRMRGRSGVLHTGHCLVRPGNLGRPGRASERSCRTAAETASTVVRFAEPSDAEIEAYVATGEPLSVAGAFTIDGLGGAFVQGIEGDPHTVVGVSLPLLRRLVTDLGVIWTDLWSR